MKVAVIGGSLQGVEAAYLAKKAGWNVLVVDKNSQAGASLISDRFLQVSITDQTDPHEILHGVDLIIPALENDSALAILENWSIESQIPLTFDMEAYAISSSKNKSNEIFKEIGLDLPRPWPECGFPVVVKPDGQSGSAGVKIIRDEKELALNYTLDELNRMVVQEYLEEPFYSIEVIGMPGNYIPLQVTELFMDSSYDCKRVKAPVQLDAGLVDQFEKMAVDIAERIGLKGIMDVEVILHDGKLKILEIDARLPSQTPTVVYHSTGINMVKMLGDLFLTGRMEIGKSTNPQSVIYEHIKVANGHIERFGEHIVSDAGPLRLVDGLFGADEVITSYQPGMGEWVATLILKGQSCEEVLDKKRSVYDNVRGLAAGN